MNKMTDFVFIREFFDTLDFDIDVIYQNYHREKGESIYLLNKHPVYIETKNEVRPQNIAMFIKHRSENLPLVVASKYITPKAKTILRDKGVNYIDSFGNVYLNFENLKLYVEKGNAKPYNSEYSSIFTQSGGQILFSLLKNPENVNETYRYLAHVSNVSLGSVSKFMKGLIDKGYIVKWSKERKYQLVRREELLDKWIILLNEKVLPTYLVGKYTFSKKNMSNWRNKQFTPNIFWAGEPAAALITNYLNPEKFTLFTNTSKQEILTDLRLLPDVNGEITIYRPFWIKSELSKQVLEDIDNSNMAHPLIVYAQLMYSENTRNIETAQLIYNEYIQPNL
jgi:hypothetical protein